MNGKAATEASAVVASVPVTVATSGIPDGLVSLIVGLTGVWLARTVFVTRENRRLQRRQTWKETLPVTGVAMLITGAWIWDSHPSISIAAFTGLGVGWTTVLLLDLFGESILSWGRRVLSASPPRPVGRLDLSGQDGRVSNADLDIPPDMAAQVDRIDQVDRQRRITDQRGHIDPPAE